MLKRNIKLLRNEGQIQCNHPLDKKFSKPHMDRTEGSKKNIIIRKVLLISISILNKKISKLIRI